MIDDDKLFLRRFLILLVSMQEMIPREQIL
jgi:hypothetical protein